jgi:competence protein ComEC
LTAEVETEDGDDFGAQAWRAPRLARVLALARNQALEDVRAQAERWFLWAPVTFGCGCGMYFALKFEPPVWAALLPAALALAMAFVVRQRVPNRALVAAASLLAFGACGFCAAKLRTLSVQAPIVWERTTGEVDGWVVDVAGPGSGGGGRLVLAPYHIQGLDDARLPARIRLTVGPDALIGPGEAIRLRAVLGPPPEPASPGAYDFARDSFFQQVGGVGFALESEPMIVQGPRPPPALSVLMAVNAARWSLARRIIDDLGPRIGGIAVAMTTGHEAWLQPSDVQSMRDSGLTHVLSISGVHMAIVGGFVFMLARLFVAAWPWAALRVNGKKLAAAIALLAIGVYLVVSGAPPPAVRSAVTLSVAFAAILVDRRAISLHSLAVAAMIVLMLQPEAVAQPGFQMSFCATAALIALAEVWPHPVREIGVPWPIRMLQGAGAWLAMAVAASFVAGAATEPFAIQHFNRVSIYGLPANLLMEPLESLLIMPGLAIGAVLEALGLGAWAEQIAGFGIDLLLKLSGWVAGWPVAAWIVPSAPDIALPISFVGIVALCLWKGRLRWLALPLALAVSIWPRPAPPVIWISSDGAQVGAVQGERVVFLKPGMKKFAADLWTKRRGLDEPKDAAADEAALSARYDCNRTRCLPIAFAEPRVAAWWTRRRPSADALADLCANADVLILKADVDPGACGGVRVLATEDFVRGGSVEIYRTSAGWRFVWANAIRGERPWTDKGS